MKAFRGLFSRLLEEGPESPLGRRWPVLGQALGQLARAAEQAQMPRIDEVRCLTQVRAELRRYVLEHFLPYTPTPTGPRYMALPLIGGQPPLNTRSWHELREGGDLAG